jgi:hypothetical protein
VCIKELEGNEMQKELNNLDHQKQVVDAYTLSLLLSLSLSLSWSRFS